MARKLTLNQARRAALRGQPDIAIPALRAFAESGDAAASASLAELLAFSGRWEEAIFSAGQLVLNPSAVYAGNVFNDTISLLGRAGQETGRWEQVADAARAAWEKCDRVEERAHIRRQHLTLLKNLENYALRDGNAPHELIRVFGVDFGHSQAELDASYRSASYKAIHENEILRDDHAKLTAYPFAIAINCNQPDEALQIYHAGDMQANFNNAVHIARLLVERGNLEGAWKVLRGHMSLWWPVDKAQVAPVILLTDTKLRTVMNQARCKEVLALPRGPEAGT